MLRWLFDRVLVGVLVFDITFPLLVNYG